MTDISGYKRGPLRNFDPILRGWIKANKLYCRRSNWQDIPWGYNERASLSIFAVGAWLARFIALEEYSEIKGSRNAPKKMVRGRCDLYVAVNSKEAYIFEAKIVWPSLATRSWKRAIDRSLEEAREDVRKTHAPSEERKVGLLLVSPYLPKSRMSKAEPLIHRFVDFLYSRRDFAAAWTFPQGARNFHWNKSTVRFPGCAILLKPLRRW
jgi:hypothetical protein